MGIRFQHNVIYPSRADLTKSFADIFQRLRAVNGLGPAPLKIDSVQPVSGSQEQCVEAIGQVNPDGNGMREMKMLLSKTSPDQYGNYFFIASQYQLPLGATEQQHAIATAIMARYKADMQLVQARATAQAAPMIAQMQRTYQAHQAALRSMQQQAIDNIHQIGANATARYNANQQMIERQHESWRQGEDDISRNNQGFHNYLLDQTVIQDNNMYGNGTIGHGTVWNSTADALVKAYPNRYEIVSTPNFWKGWDY